MTKKGSFQSRTEGDDVSYMESVSRELEALKALTNPVVREQLLKAFQEEKILPLAFVEQNYEMNPETEELLKDGSYLRDGMIILDAQPNRRASTTRDEEGEIPNWIRERILERNRWFVISDVDISTKYGTVQFTSTFADGRRRRSERPLNIAWLVKSKTAPKHKRFAAVLELVNQAMEEQRAGSLVNDSEIPIGTPEGMIAAHLFDANECAERIAREINDLLDK